MSQAHVPPQSCLEKDKKNRVATQYFFGDQTYSLQNGIHFYTLCAGCNGIFGSYYDKELTTLSKTWRSVYQYPSIDGVFCKPNRVVRSLAGGYLAAAGKHMDRRLKADLQRYVLDESNILPESLRIGVWFHPYDSVLIKPDYIFLDPKYGVLKINFLLKYFPLTWMVYSVENKADSFHHQHNFEEISSLLCSNIDAEKSIRINRKTEKPELWPGLSEDTAVLIGESAKNNAIFAYAK